MDVFECLATERKIWRRQPMYGFSARPRKNWDGTLNLLKWECGIPGKENTPWEGGNYKLILSFPKDYPDTPPICTFIKKIFHPNVFPSGRVCLPTPDKNTLWKRACTIKRVLMEIYQLLSHPNIQEPVNSEAYLLYTNDYPAYVKRVKLQVIASVEDLW